MPLTSFSQIPQSQKEQVNAQNKFLFSCIGVAGCLYNLSNLSQVNSNHPLNTIVPLVTVVHIYITTIMHNNHMEARNLTHTLDNEFKQILPENPQRNALIKFIRELKDSNPSSLQDMNNITKRLTEEEKLCLKAISDNPQLQTYIPQNLEDALKSITVNN